MECDLICKNVNYIGHHFVTKYKLLFHYLLTRSTNFISKQFG